MEPNHYGVIIVGAGMSGIGTAYWLKKKCPQKSFAILESRDAIGGTWSLFKYPGVRSDSDMFTFGYRFKPWTSPQPFSDGENILKYVESVVEENDLYSNIQFGKNMTSANWNGEMWVLTVNEHTQYTCQYLAICTGYYDYEESYQPQFSHQSQFKGLTINPQFWPENVDLKDKDIVVIGSGATAVTLVPALVREGAKHVTMLQRSPTYVMNLPNNNGVYVSLAKILPQKWAFKITRGLNLSLSMLSFGVSKAFPEFMKKTIIKGAAKQLPAGYPTDVHFSPRYNPWDQRLCVVPDGDLFKAIKDEKASVVTDTIRQFSESGLITTSSGNLKADIVIIATGLKLKLMGGAQICVKNEPINTQDTFVYKGMMISDIPNMVYAFGYTNAAWTLKVDLTANYLCDLINYMDKKGYKSVFAPKPKDDSNKSFVDLSSGYIMRGNDLLPKQGKKKPWKVSQNYFKDMMAIRYGRIKDKVLLFK